MVKSHKRAVGSRAEVWHGNADHTTGGLQKKNLYKNKHGRIVSLKKHNSAKREKRLIKHGYGTKKGQFGFVKHGKHSRKHRGGHAGVNMDLSPSQAAWDGEGIDGQGLYVGSSFSGPETAALNASGGRRKKHRHHGGHAGVTTNLTPAQAALDGYGIDGAGITQGSLQSQAGMSGGRRRRRRRNTKRHSRRHSRRH